jgi:hypothetical protein
MNNYQLYRTNLLLGGQMKWDLILDNAKNTLRVSDFHLTPISDNMPYTYKTDEYLINNSHQDNVKAYYTANKGNFYNEFIDSSFAHNWPIISDDTYVTTYNDIYNMGCKRTKHYGKYNKQFEFLCPLWLEQLSPDSKLTFKILVKNLNDDVTIASNVITLDLMSATHDSTGYHNKFVKYFRNYISDTGISTGCDDILNVIFNQNDATITGLNASTGLFETRHIPNLIDNFTLCERPLMETDNMLVQAFVDNSMICKQLFNFNLCFNIEDILSGSIANMMRGVDIKIAVDVYINDNKSDILLEKRDFYTEYEFINRKISGFTDANYGKNVLDYLQDYQYIDLIDKNKFCQNICHWSLYDNNDYIFNVYNGFSGLHYDVNNDGTYNIYENEHQYGSTPNTHINKYDNGLHSADWIAHKHIKKWSDVYKYIINPSRHKKDGTFIGDNNYVNGIKYKYIPKFWDKSGMYFMSILIPSDMLLSIKSAFSFDKTLEQHSIYILILDDFVLIISDKPDALSFGGFYNILNECTDLESSETPTVKSLLFKLLKMMQQKVEPSIVTFANSLMYNNANGPTIDIQEITYYKDNTAGDYVIRYDGKLKPTFITHNNTLYYKQLLRTPETKNSIYAQYGNSGFEPLYPSINYYAIKMLNATDWNYTSPPDTLLACMIPYEYSWFNDNNCLLLDPDITFIYKNVKDSQTGEYMSLEDIVTSLLSDYYNTNDMKLISYIRSLYNCNNDWEYASIDNIDDYIYTIKLTLK